MSHNSYTCREADMEVIEKQDTPKKKVPIPEKKKPQRKSLHEEMELEMEMDMEMVEAPPEKKKKKKVEIFFHEPVSSEKKKPSPAKVFFPTPDLEAPFHRLRNSDRSISYESDRSSDEDDGNTRLSPHGKFPSGGRHASIYELLKVPWSAFSFKHPQALSSAFSGTHLCRASNHQTMKFN